MKAFTVLVPEKLNLEQCHKVLASVLVKAGHPSCFSGFKISFENAVNPGSVLLHVDKTHLNVSEVGG